MPHLEGMSCGYLTSGHMGVKRTSHCVLEWGFFWKGVTKDIEIMVSVE